MYANYKSLATGNLYAKIYAHTGTYGTSSLPTGPALATSNAVAISSIIDGLVGFELVTFTFSGANQISLAANTKYVFVLQNTSTAIADTVTLGIDSSGSHSGNSGTYDSGTSSWSAVATRDHCFYVYGSSTTATVTTQACSSVTFEGATGNGNVTATGGVVVTRRGFCYVAGTSGDPTTANSTVYDDGTFNEGAYTKAITGLTAVTGYRVRAYCVTSEGTSYGSTVQLTTASADGPVVTTTTTSLLKKNAAIVGGDVTDSGTESVTERGIYWGTSEETQATKIAQGSGEGAYPILMTGLTKDTTYYYKAFATSSVSTGYGDILSFTTGNEPTEQGLYALPPFAN